MTQDLVFIILVSSCEYSLTICAISYAIQHRELVPRSFDSFLTSVHKHVPYRSVRWCCVMLHAQALFWLILNHCTNMYHTGLSYDAVLCCKHRFEIYGTTPAYSNIGFHFETLARNGLCGGKRLLSTNLRFLTSLFWLGRSRKFNKNCSLSFISLVCIPNIHPKYIIVSCIENSPYKAISCIQNKYK